MKKLLLIMLVLLIAGLAFGDVVIGNGTSTDYYPMSTLYNYYRSAALYTAADISANDGPITNLQWYCGTANTTTSIPVKIYMKYTAAAALTGDTWVNLVAGTTQVFNATITANATGWFNFDITDFAYDGDLGNLMVLVESGSAAYVSPYVMWQYTTTGVSGSYKFASNRADGSAPTSLTAGSARPNIKLVGINAAVYPEPTNHVLDFTTGTLTYTSIPLNWTGAVGAQLPASYLIQAKIATGTFAPVADGTPVANDAVWTDGNFAINVAHAVGANTYTLTGLTPNTAYEVKIWPYTNSGANINFKTDAPIPTVNASTLDPTQPLPYTQNFNGGTSLTTIGWTGDMSISSTHGNAGSNGLYRNLYSYVPTTNVVSCPIGPMVANAELDFDYRIVDYSGYPATGTDLSATDKIEVQISTNGGTSFTTIYTINSANHVTSNAFASKVVELDAYSTGNIYVKFLSTWGAGDYYVDIDNVQVRETPAAPIFSLTPALSETWPFGLVPVGGFAEKSFTISNTGAGTLTISGITTSNPYYSVIEVAPVNHALAAGQTTTFKARFTPTIAGGPFNGTVTIAYNDGTAQTLALNFSGSAYQPATLPLTEGWESGIGNWTVVNGTQTNQWYLGTADPHAGENSAYISNTAGLSNVYDNAVTSVVHVYQDIAFDADCLEFPLSFYWKGYGESSSYDYLQVYLVDTNVTPVAGTRLTTGQVGANYNLQSSWNQANITLPGTLSGSVKRLVFSWWNDSSGGANPPINIDDISLTAVPSPSGPVAAPNLDYPNDTTPPLPIGGFPFQFSWNTAGVEPSAYTLVVYNSNTNEAEFFDSPYTYEDVTSPYTPTGIPYAYDEHWYWTVKGYDVDLDTWVYQWPPSEFVIEDDPANFIYPYEEAFDTLALGDMPAGWTIFDTSGGWQAAANIVPNSAPNAATIYYNSLLPKDDWMITLPMNMEAGTLYNISFMLKAPGWSDTPEALALHVGDAPTIAAMNAGTTLYNNAAIELADWTNITVPFTPLTTGNYFFGWHAYSVADVDYIAVDDVMIYTPANVDLAATGISGDGSGYVDSPVSTTVTVSNLGTTGQSSYTVYVKKSSDNSILGQFTESLELASLASREHVISWTPTVAGTVSIYGEVLCPGDATPANNTTTPMNVVVFTATTQMAYVGDPATTWVSSASPFDLYYEDHVTETIYLGSELMMSSGTINAIAYYNSFDVAQTKTVQIWMKNTTANDLTADWLTWDGYVPVFNGDLICPAGANEIVIPITPFAYTGGNLAIRTSRTWLGEWSSGKNWYVTENPNYINRTRYYREDSDLVDHTAPVGGYTSSYVPNALFIFDPATPISSIAAPAITISNVGTDVSVDWAPIPYAYSYNVYTSDDPYLFGAVPEYTVYTDILTLTPGVDDVREFFKVTAATYRTGYRNIPAFLSTLRSNSSKLKSADPITTPKVRQKLSK